MQTLLPSVFACASVLALAFPSYAEVVTGETSSDYATVTIEENIANPEVPTHYIFLNPLEGSSSAGSLILRCKDNKTEAYYTAAQFEFFNIGAAPDINARFASEGTSKALAASGSAGMGEAAFIKNPIGFIVNFVGEKEVVLSGSYYGGSFAALFKADDLVVKAVYDMANTCQWKEKLPVVEEVPVEEVNTLSTEDEKKAALQADLNALVAKYGLPEIKEMISLFE